MSIKMFSMLLGLLGALLWTPCHVSSAPVQIISSNHWVDTWTAMPQLTEYTNLPPPPFNSSGLVFPNATIRQTLHMSIGGEQIRIRFSNAFSNVSLPITAATVALPLNGSSGDSNVKVQTLQTLTFSGSPNITIPDGALAVSDILQFPIQPQSTITVTVYLADGQASNYITSHPGSRATSYISYGNYVDAANMTDPSTVQTAHWYFVSAVETWATSESSAFAIVGDSITDGRASDTDGNDRWPDLLLARMQQDSATANIAVNNQAAGGNRILADGNGPNAFGRIDRDVLAQSGVKYAMIFEGVNDIGVAPATVEAQQNIGDDLINAFEQMITRIHTFGIPFFAATITPFSAPNSTIQPYSDPIREATRQRVNNWIRYNSSFDAVIDFDKLVADPSNPAQLAPAYNSGDYLHPGVGGYHVFANAFPISLFTQFANGVSTYS